ncbi:MAG: hypothetical protein CBC42_03320 [Betaproteobacteria bacterium TMED82]|nr:MAG: hypothetical protein CBC42_03320 [Betaproteobacteria bacterium TMED82]
MNTLISLPFVIFCTISILAYSFFSFLGKKEVVYWLGKSHSKKDTAKQNILWLSLAIIFCLIYYSAISFSLNGNIFLTKEGYLNICLICCWLGILINLGKIDHKNRLLPYSLTITLIILGLFFHCVNDSKQFFFKLMSVFFCLSFLFILRKITKFFLTRNRKVDPIGVGDIFFIAGLASWVDIYFLSIITLSASVGTLIFSYLNFKPFSELIYKQIPLGPGLTVSGLTIGLFYLFPTTSLASCL